jgi:cohesin complex subunit SA-1/2
LVPLVEEWVEVYQQSADDEVSEKASVHELILLFVRCCGLSATVDADEAVDVDGVVDTIERLQDESVKVSSSVTAAKMVSSSCS